jgi:hypothetical protein
MARPRRPGLPSRCRARTGRRGAESPSLAAAGPFSVLLRRDLRPPRRRPAPPGPTALPTGRWWSGSPGRGAPTERSNGRRLKRSAAGPPASGARVLVDDVRPPDSAEWAGGAVPGPTVEHRSSAGGGRSTRRSACGGACCATARRGRWSTPPAAQLVVLGSRGRSDTGGPAAGLGQPRCRARRALPGRDRATGNRLVKRRSSRRGSGGPSVPVASTAPTGARPRTGSGAMPHRRPRSGPPGSRRSR